MTWNCVVKDSKVKTVMMGLACGKIGREGMCTDDYLCSIANLFWFYVGSERALTFFFPRPLCCGRENSHLRLLISKNRSNIRIAVYTLSYYMCLYFSVS
jgi:hypothetical protein